MVEVEEEKEKEKYARDGEKGKVKVQVVKWFMKQGLTSLPLRVRRGGKATTEFRLTMGCTPAKEGRRQGRPAGAEIFLLLE